MTKKPVPVPYFYDSGNGTSGRVVLHTIANNGGCSDKWGNFWRFLNLMMSSTKN